MPLPLPITTLAGGCPTALQRTGTFYEIPESFHPPIEQAVVVVNSSNRKPLARQFIEFLKRPAISRLMQEFGFGAP